MGNDFLGPLGVIGDIGGGILSLFGVAEENRLNEALTREGVGLLDPLANFDVRRFQAEQGVPFTFGGQRFGIDTVEGGSRINLDDLFSSSTDFNALRGDVRGELLGGAAAARGELAGAESDISDRFSSARAFFLGQQGDPSARAAEVGAFLPTADITARLNAALQGIGASSRARLGTARQQTIAGALSRGGSLESAQGALDSLSFGESQVRALDASGARAESERAISLREEKRAEQQLKAFLEQLGINADFGELAGETFGDEADLLAELGIEKADLETQLGGDLGAALTNIGFFESETERQGQLGAGALFQDLQALSNRAGEFGQSIRTQGITGQANLLAGIPAQRLFLDPGKIVSGAIGNLQQFDIAQNASNQDQGKSSNFGLGYEGTGIQFCVDADATVEVKGRGKIALRDVLPGDEARGEDGEFHMVIGKDCGIAPVDHRGNHVRIETGRLGKSIVLTTDHPIDGRPAGQWEVGDPVQIGGFTDKVVSVEPHKYVVSGDLMLQGNVRYVANGFPIDSTIGAQGDLAWYHYLMELGAMEVNGFVHDKANPIGGWALAA